MVCAASQVHHYHYCYAAAAAATTTAAAAAAAATATATVTASCCDSYCDADFEFRLDLVDQQKYLLFAYGFAIGCKFSMVSSAG